MTHAITSTNISFSDSMFVVVRTGLSSERDYYIHSSLCALCVSVSAVVLLVWHSGNCVTAYRTSVALRRAGLVLGWVTARGYTVLVFNQPPRSTQPGHPSVSRRNELAIASATLKEETASSA